MKKTEEIAKAAQRIRVRVKAYQTHNKRFEEDYKKLIIEEESENYGLDPKFMSTLLGSLTTIYL